MKIISFNLTKISAEKRPDLKLDSSTNTNIDFTDLKKEKIDSFKDLELIKLSFRYSVSYSDKEKKKGKTNDSEVSIEGEILISTEGNESETIIKSWKKKELAESFKIPLFNLILKKCTVKSIQLEEELNLPIHMPLPKLVPKQEN